MLTADYSILVNLHFITQAIIGKVQLLYGLAANATVNQNSDDTFAIFMIIAQDYQFTRQIRWAQADLMKHVIQRFNPKAVGALQRVWREHPDVIGFNQPLSVWRPSDGWPMSNQSTAENTESDNGSQTMTPNRLPCRYWATTRTVSHGVGVLRLRFGPSGLSHGRTVTPRGESVWVPSSTAHQFAGTVGAHAADSPHNIECWAALVMVRQPGSGRFFDWPSGRIGVTRTPSLLVSCSSDVSTTSIRFRIRLMVR